MSFSSNLLFNFYCFLLCDHFLTFFPPNSNGTKNREKKMNLLGPVLDIYGAI